MSNSSIEGRLKGLQERFENEMRIRPGAVQRRRPPAMFPSSIQSFPTRSPQVTETESRMREVKEVSGKLNVGGREYLSSIDELQQLGELGSGTCGHVVKMLHKPSAAVIAVKQMRRSGNCEETKRILMDLDVVVRSHDCPYIVRCFGCFVTDADVWICMELMASCFDKLLKRLKAPIPEEILGKVTVATVNALSYLKDSHGVIHRDVKPSNILLDERGNVKLCDFGISGRLVDSKAKTRSAGCAAYMAPERIDPPDPTRPDYDIRADVWSLGISLVELATGVFPYRDCTNDFEVLTRVIADDPPQLPNDSNFTPEFKLFVTQCLTKNYRQRPKYAKLLEHPFVVKSTRNTISVGDWYAQLPGSSPSVGRPAVSTVATHGVLPANGVEPSRNFVTSQRDPVRNFVTASHEPVRNYVTSAHHEPVRNFVTSSQHEPVRNYVTSAQHEPVRNYVTSAQQEPIRNFVSSAQHEPVRNYATSAHHFEPVRNFVTSAQHWLPEQVTPTPARTRWGSGSSAGGSSSQPTSLETEWATHSPYPRRRTIDVGAEPPPPPARRVSDTRWRPSPASSGNTSPIVLQRFYHQQQRRSRVDLHATPRHRSLSREHSAGRSPEPPPRMHRQHHMLGHEANSSMEFEPPPTLHDRLHPHPPSPLLLNDRLAEGRSQSLTRAELRNGHRAEPPASPRPHRHKHDDQGWLHSLAGLVKRRLSGYVKWHHVAAHSPRRTVPHAAAAAAATRWGGTESWSVPASPLPPRAPPPRPAAAD